MGCWVAPAIAAELWGMSIKDVLDLILHGRVQSRQDGEFSFVRLAEYSPVGQRRPPAERPATFTPVTSQEFASLSANTSGESAKPTGGSEFNQMETEMGPPPDGEDPKDDQVANWRVVRQLTSKLRRRPPSASA